MRVLFKYFTLLAFSAAIFASPAQAHFDQTKNYLTKLLRRIARVLPPDAPEPREFELELLVNWDVPTVQVFYASSTDQMGFKPIVKINLSALWAFATTGKLLAILAHEAAHPLVSLRNRGLPADVRKEEAETDQLAYEIMRAIGEDPALLAEAVESLMAWENPKAFLHDPIHYPMGLFPMAVEPGTDQGTSGIDHSLVRHHPTNIVRVVTTHFRRIGDDLAERTPARFPADRAYPPEVWRELKEIPTLAFRRRHDLALYEARRLPPAGRLAALYDFALHAQETKDGSENHRRVTAYAELAQIMRLLSEKDPRDRSDPTLTDDARTALRLFDFLFFRLDRPNVDFLKSDVSPDNLELLLLEALRFARLFEPSLLLEKTASKAALLEEWIDAMDDRSVEQRRKEKNAFLSHQSNFLSLLVIANPDCYQSLNSDDMELLLESPRLAGRSWEAPLLDGNGLFSLIFGVSFRSGIFAFVDRQAFFSPLIRPALEHINSTAKALSTHPLWARIEHGHHPKFSVRSFLERGWGVRLSEHISEKSDTTPSASWELDESFTQLVLPNLAETPDYAAYRAKYSAGKNESGRIDSGWNWDRLRYPDRGERDEETGAPELSEILGRLRHLPKEARKQIFQDGMQVAFGVLDVLEVELTEVVKHKTEVALREYYLEHIMKLHADEDDSLYFDLATVEANLRLALTRVEWENLRAKHAMQIFLELKKVVMPSDLSPVRFLQEMEDAKSHFDMDGSVDWGVIPMDVLTALNTLSAEQVRQGDRVRDPREDGTRKGLSIDRTYKKNGKILKGKVWKLVASAWNRSFRELVSTKDLSDPQSEPNILLEKLQAHILEDLRYSEKSSQVPLSDFRDTVVALFILNPLSKPAQDALETFAKALRVETESESRFTHVAALLAEFKKAGISLRVADVNALGEELIGHTRQALLEVSPQDPEYSQKRLALLKEALKGIESAFRDSPFYPLFDPKLDRLAEEIQASMQEAAAIHSAKTIARDPLDYLFGHDSTSVRKTNMALTVLDFIVATMRMRTTRENSQVRDYFLSRSRPDVNEAEVRERIVNDLLSLGSENLLKLLGERLSGNLDYDDEDEADFDSEHKMILTDEVRRLREEFRLLRPNDRLVFASFLLVADSKDGTLIDSPWFQNRVIEEFFGEERSTDKGAYHILAEELLLAFEPSARALLITQAELQNRMLLSEGDLRDLQAERIATLLSSLGAYGYKLGQLISRIPGIDSVLAARLKKLEDRANTPDYHSLYEALAPHLLDDEKRDLVRIFGVRAGSMKITLFVEFRDPTGTVYKKAFSLRREHVGRMILRMHERVKIALRRAYERTKLETFKPFLSLPDDAEGMLRAEMNFPGEVERLGEAARSISEVKTENELGVSVISAERISLPEGTDPAIVFPYLDALRLDEVPEAQQALLFEKLLRIDIRLFLKVQNREKSHVKLDTDRHLGNILVTEGDSEGDFEAVHIDMGQWVSLPQSHRDLFARLLVALLTDFSQKNPSFLEIQHILIHAFDVRALDETWWSSLQADLRSIETTALQNPLSATLTGILFIREAIHSTDGPIGESLFRFTKYFETWLGVAHQLKLEALFQRVLMEELAARVGPLRAPLLVTDPVSLARQEFRSPASLRTEAFSCVRGLASP